MKCLIVVAHPDDETIWIGGLILRHPKWEWRVFSLSRSDDPDRRPRFRRAAQELGAASFISDLDDSPVLAPLSEELHEIKDRVQTALSDQFDLIFTHGAAGEYTRHPRHEQVHRAVRQMAEDEGFTKRLLFFAYDDCRGACIPKPASNADILLHLSQAEYSRKRQIIRDTYGFAEESFEFRAAGPIEAFRTCSNGRGSHDLIAVLERSDSEG